MTVRSVYAGRVHGTPQRIDPTLTHDDVQVSELTRLSVPVRVRAAVWADAARHLEGLLLDHLGVETRLDGRQRAHRSLTIMRSRRSSSHNSVYGTVSISGVSSDVRGQALSPMRGEDGTPSVRRHSRYRAEEKRADVSLVSSAARGESLSIEQPRQQCEIVGNVLKRLRTGLILVHSIDPRSAHRPHASVEPSEQRCADVDHLVANALV